MNHDIRLYLRSALARDRAHIQRMLRKYGRGIPDRRKLALLAHWSSELMDNTASHEAFGFPVIEPR